MKYRISNVIQGICEKLRTFGLGWGLVVIAMGLLPGCQSPPTRATGSVGGVPADAFSTNLMRLQEGDVIRVAFENATNLNTTQTILLDGFITLPLIGKIKAAGETILDLEASLTALYKPQIRATEITVARVTSAAAYYVGGAVLRPGRLPLERPMTVLDAIFEAGGVDHARAKLTEVVILRIENNQRVRYQVNLKRALNGLDTDLFYLRPFDIIYVPEKTFNF